MEGLKKPNYETYVKGQVTLVKDIEEKYKDLYKVIGEIERMNVELVKFAQESEIPTLISDAKTKLQVLKYNLTERIANGCFTIGKCEQHIGEKENAL